MLYGESAIASSAAIRVIAKCIVGVSRKVYRRCIAHTKIGISADVGVAVCCC